MMNNLQLEITAYKIRRHVIEGVFHAASGHPGGSLSIADIITYKKHPSDRVLFLCERGMNSLSVFSEDNGRSGRFDFVQVPH